MNFNVLVPMLVLGKHLMWSRQDGSGGTIYYYYYDEVTWIAGALALAWLTWFVAVRYRRASALRRPPRPTDHRLLRRIVGIKSELSSTYMRPGFSANIHAVGIGLLGDQYCIQIFVSDANEELWAGSAGAPLPNNYRGVPLLLIEMPPAGFLPGAGLSPDARHASSGRHLDAIREYQEVIIGGISGANTNLTGQSGTIGYFCTRKSRRPGPKDVLLLSNSHVFADLRKAAVDEGDLIMQPSPGEPGNNRPIGALVSFSALKFNGDTSEPNHIDAAIARLWSPHQHKPVLPMIGAVKGYVAKKDIQVGEAARKFGRTTGYTEGFITSIYLDIRIRYDRTGQSAFFKDQLLIEPALPDFQKFVAKGDSGSLAVDGNQHAIGLIFAGVSDAPQGTRALGTAPIDPATDKPMRIEGYGVANPISEVLDRMKIDLLV